MIVLLKCYLVLPRGIEPRSRALQAHAMTTSAKAALLKWYLWVGTIHRPSPYQDDALPLSYKGNVKQDAHLVSI
jgi:hypothetical protein